MIHVVTFNITESTRLNSTYAVTKASAFVYINKLMHLISELNALTCNNQIKPVTHEVQQMWSCHEVRLDYIKMRVCKKELSLK